MRRPKPIDAEQYFEMVRQYGEIEDKIAELTRENQDDGALISDQFVAKQKIKELERFAEELDEYIAVREKDLREMGYTKIEHKFATPEFEEFLKTEGIHMGDLKRDKSNNFWFRSRLQ